MQPVPVVDIRQPSATSLEALDAACVDHGFFLLEGHGLDDLIDRTWDQTRTFFGSSPEVKESVRRNSDTMLGWYDRELTKRLRDHKEVFDFFDPSLPREHNPNVWPAEMDKFRSTMTQYFDAFAALAAETLALVHHTLGLSGTTAASHVNERSTSTVRLNHYPVGDPVPADQRDGLNDLGDVALGHHTDPGVITLLLQDETGGLQTESTEHGWIDIDPRPGTIVVNLADAMQVWTNDRYRAAVHRVVPMTDRSRYSIPFFSNPPRNAVIAPISELAGESPRYRSFTWREFIRGRSEDNFADIGAEDIQIANFRI